MARPLGSGRAVAAAGRGHPHRRRWPRMAAAGSRVAAGRQLQRWHAVIGPGARRVSGAALLLVLWLIVLLTGLVGGFALQALDAGQVQAGRLAAAIADWRD